jgi:hypothetical protein
MTNQITYDTCFVPYIGKFTKIILDDDHSTKLASAVGGMIKTHEKQVNRKINQIEIDKYKKIYTQLAGDVVLEQLLELDFVDFNKFVPGQQSFISKITKNNNVSVVTFSYGLFPLVYKTTSKKTIFICMLNKKEFYVCGLGEPNIVSGFNTQSLVYSERLREMNKSAFYAFYHLKPITNNLTDFFRLVK